MTAEIMNKYFVNIKVSMHKLLDFSIPLRNLTYPFHNKVDREERPDVDRMYMTFLQATQGGGGWPLSVCEHDTLPRRSA